MIICEGGHVDILALFLSPTAHLFTIPSYNHVITLGVSAGTTGAFRQLQPLTCAWLLSEAS